MIVRSSAVTQLRYAMLSVFVVVALPGSSVATNDSPDGIWSETAPVVVMSDVPGPSARLLAMFQDARHPAASRLFALNATRLNAALVPAAGALDTAETGGAVATLPLPDGRYVRIRFVPSTVMSDELSRQFSQLKTYRGIGVDDPAISASLLNTPSGIRAIVFEPEATTYIDPSPLSATDRVTHMSYLDRAQMGHPSGRCLLTEDDLPQGRGMAARPPSPPMPFPGNQIRTYRLGVAATAEYAQFHGGTVEKTLAAIVTTIMRVDGIYRREFAVQFSLIGDEQRLIFLDPKQQPYTNDNPHALLTQNQATFDEVIGAANYDIGHVFSTAGGGLAQLASVGDKWRKAMGETGSSSPTGDPFDVDYVAHEIGHQFGANHTFNGTTESCGKGNRHEATAYEPGSGSTIMGYAGICGSENLQPHSDATFHGSSLDEIVSFITSPSVEKVPTVTTVTNGPPQVKVPSDHLIIPKTTSFMLTAIGSDPDGDEVIYSWEEFDLGGAAPPNDDIGDGRPVFRSQPPTRDGTRMFPSPTTLVAGPTLGEGYFSTPRDRWVRVTVRDMRGGLGVARVQLTVDKSGPFVVLAPISTKVWRSGSTEVVRWDPAGTTEAPLSASSVDVSLSVDGGKSFTTLASGVPNNGAASIKVPSTASTDAVVRIQPTNGVFYAQSRPFTVAP